MKVINYVHIKDTFAHRDSKIEFTDGKNYIVGKIGSGKSVILESIAFAFFGTVALRDKATSYKNIYVELSFNYSGETFLIKRKINDASLYLFDKTTQEFEEIVTSTSVVNQKIISLLGYNYDIFLLSNFCKQKKLAYFSELTPAKRLQYIDKISGLEESKELSKWLLAKRKTLKSNIALISSVNIAPKLSNGVDLNFDYDANISVLTERLDSVNDLYNQYHEYRKESINPLNLPVLKSDKITSQFSQMDPELLESCYQYLNTLESIEEQIKNTENSLRLLPKISSQFATKTLEEIESIIYKYNSYMVHSFSGEVKGSCKSCGAEVLVKDLLDKPESFPTDFNIKDVYIVQDYLKSGLDVTKKQLAQTLRSLEKEYNTLMSNPPVPSLYEYHIQSIERMLEKGLRDQEEYDSLLTAYNSKEECCVLARQNSTIVEKQINEFLESQKEVLLLKDQYIKFNTEKNLYLQQLEVYLQAKEKTDQFSIELSLINNLIKDVSEISTQIKNQTIPLINHHASKYLNLITKGSMAKIEITEDYDLIVDGFKIGVKSGGQQDLASLAFRLSLSQSVINGMLPLFLADEVDSAGNEGDSNDIIEALDSISNNGFQIILITHKDSSNIENANIIQL